MYTALTKLDIVHRADTFHFDRVCSRFQAKVQRGEYSTLKDVKDDADLMCKNCMVYNSDDTIFYKVTRNVLYLTSHCLSHLQTLNLNKAAINRILHRNV